MSASVVLTEFCETFSAAKLIADIVCNRRIEKIV